MVGRRLSESHGWIEASSERRMRGYYSAESPDGRWVLMKYSNGPMNSVAWFRRDQVTFDAEYQPVYRTPSAPTVRRLERSVPETDPSGS